MEQDKTLEKKKTRKIYFAVFLVVLLLAAISLFSYWDIILRHQVTTDDAYVTGNMNSISSQISGSVTSVNYTNTEYVHQGDILVSLDKTDTLIAFNQAKNNLANTVREMRKLYLLASQYQANVAAAQIQSKQASEDYLRRQRLAGSGLIAREDLEHSKDNAISSKAALEAAIQAYNANRALIMDTTLEKQPQVLQAAEQMKQAWLALQRTDIRSPVTGYVAQRNVQVGETIASAQPLLAVVPAQQMWVNANFKETQLTNVKIGQRVTLTSDLYGDKVIFHGHVKGINMGTGNAFSLLPSQNASGNWIKVVQRVPVEIELDKGEIGRYPLRIGLSMNATIDTDGTTSAPMPVNSYVTSVVPAYASDALVIDTGPVDDEIHTIIKINGQR
ncbi:multidrug export protein EmrA [Enterobacter cancerogenus]|uniref:EmrA/EmrK family multidrug efflux transporter periplasmic adaptor subunit n=1 Tax=Enterobacter cancerogenus TaxID=69218 RepID=UPI000C9D23C2|nr:EmrA/EmrK family multidrug efflux transporter periplasmic adaptor subunit [Enterobacter cancerogenus]PNF10853.1 multidrug export protein EmrA [Enterobacter cancerogenus]